MKPYYKAIYNIIKVTKSIVTETVSTVEKTYKTKQKYQRCKNKMIRDVKEIECVLNIPEEENNETKKESQKAFK